MDRKWRPVVAGMLAFLYPGLGHVYLRAWFRAAAWFTIALATALFVVGDGTLQAMGSGDLDAMIEASQSLSLETTAALLAVRVLNVVDAYLVASRPALLGLEPRDAHVGPGDGPGQCPSCGKDLDADLDFCPWCTQRLETDSEDSSGGGNSGDRTPASR